MKRKRLPTLPDTGRRYVEHTQRARLASPGIERYAGRGGRGRVGGAIAAALALAAALVATMLFLS
jgi:hypothetical protein